MGICVPKQSSGGEPGGPDEMEGDVPLSPTSKKRSELPRMAPGADAFDEEVRSPDPSPVKGAAAAKEVDVGGEEPRRCVHDSTHGSARHARANANTRTRTHTPPLGCVANI